MAKLRSATASNDVSFVLDSNAYQLTLDGLVMPVGRHVAFNALGSLTAILLGHPVIGLVALFTNSLVDALFQARVARLRMEDRPTDTAAAFKRVAVLCALRNGVLLGPAVAMSLGGGAAEMAYLGVVSCILCVLAVNNGTLSRPVFYAYAGPPLIASLAVILIALPLAKAGGVLIGVATLGLLTTGASAALNKSITALRGAYQTNRALIGELEQARDQALAERAAADEAREAARRANAAKSNFLATMSHEIRTPMNGVMGMAQLLRRDETDPGQIARLDTLVESGEYLLSILNDILDVSKIDAGRLEIAPKPDDPRRFVEQVVDFWGARADEKGVALRLELVGALPPVVLMDSFRLRQVLFNLIGNALKFTEAGMVTLTVDGRQGGDGQARLHLAVRDTGPGIAEDHLPVLFDRFSQGEESEARRFGGTGLGLAIAKQLVELMEGRIWVESVLGAGSTFQIDLPMVEAERAAPTVEVARVDVLAPTLGVLIVDDNAINLLVLEQLLGALGHRVAKAASGQEALDRLAIEVFDLVVMDIQMPQMTGTEVLDRLRATSGPNHTVPVIALTADVTSGGRKKYLELGFNDHASKPIQIDELIDAISRATQVAQKAGRSIEAA